MRPPTGKIQTYHCVNSRNVEWCVKLYSGIDFTDTEILNLHQHQINISNRALNCPNDCFYFRLYSCIVLNLLS